MVSSPANAEIQMNWSNPPRFAMSSAALISVLARSLAAGLPTLEDTVALFAERLNAPPVNPAIRLNDLHLYAYLREKLGRRAAGLT